VSEYNLVVKNLSKSFNIIKTVKEDKDSFYRKIQSIFFGSSFLGYKRQIYVKQVLKDISFEVKNREYFGILGPNGSGKTTLLSIIGTLFPPDSGEITIFDMDYYKHRNEIRKYIVPLFSWIQLHDIMGSTQGTGRQVIERLLLYHDIDPKSVSKEIKTYSEELGVADRLDDWIMRLSDGMRMKMFIIASMIIIENYDKFLLLCDEPFIYLDVATISYFKKFLENNVRDKRFSVIVASNLPNHIELFCNRVIVLDKGSIIFKGSLSKLKKLYASHIIKITVKDNNIDRLLLKLSNLEVLSYTRRGEIYELKIMTKEPETIVPFIVDAVYQSGFKLIKLSIESPSIEEIVLKIIEEGKKFEET